MERGRNTEGLWGTENREQGTDGIEPTNKDKLKGVRALSFSYSVKNELCRIVNSGNCCLLSELAAIIRFGGSMKRSGGYSGSISVATENAPLARRIYSEIKTLFGIYPIVRSRKSRKLKKHISYYITVEGRENTARILDAVKTEFDFEKNNFTANYSADRKKLFSKSCCKKAYLRGAFLAGGSLSDPEKAYHLEIVSRSYAQADELVILMNHYNLNAKIVKRKDNHVAYLKEGENIVDFLNIIGAHSALMGIENIRILKEVRNNVNRIVNCETANLGKIVKASVKQIDIIKHVRDTIGFEKLPESLREIAELRLRHSDASLKELGEMLSPPLGKSGVNHRLRKIERMAGIERMQETGEISGIDKDGKSNHA